MQIIIKKNVMIKFKQLVLSVYDKVKLPKRGSLSKNEVGRCVTVVLELFPVPFCLPLPASLSLCTWLPVTRPFRATIYLSICECARLRVAIRSRGCL